VLVDLEMLRWGFKVMRQWMEDGMTY
jgi:hypothetical protein